MTNNPTPVEQRHRNVLPEDVWLSIPKYLHKPIASYIANFERDHMPASDSEPVAWMYERNGCFVLKKNRTPEYTTPVMDHTETPLYARAHCTRADALREALRNLISLARPHFSDDVQMLALQQAEAALSDAPQARRSTPEMKRRAIEIGAQLDAEDGGYPVPQAASDEAMVERVARIIDPSAWAVMDAELERMKRKYRGKNIGWPADQFQHKESMAKAKAALAAMEGQP